VYSCVCVCCGTCVCLNECRRCVKGVCVFKRACLCGCGGVSLHVGLYVCKSVWPCLSLIICMMFLC